MSQTHQLRVTGSMWQVLMWLVAALVDSGEESISSTAGSSIG